MMSKPQNPMFDLGLENRKSVLGAEQVENSWAAVRGRDNLSRKTRSLLNIAMRTALNRPHDLKVHIAVALRNSATVEEIRGVLVQAAIYCGVQAALDSFRVTSEAIKGYSAPKGA